MKTKARIEEKLQELKKKAKFSATEGSGLFHHWLGWMRALEWVLTKEKEK